VEQVNLLFLLRFAMAEIHLPHTSWFSYESVPLAYQHHGLAQQVLAHKAAKLNKELESLLARYEADAREIRQLQSQADILAKKINRLTADSKIKDKLLAQQQQLKAELKAHEKALLSSKITIEISRLRSNINVITKQLSLPA
jgi:uncharacterized protein YdgA (DUF945 family)